LNAKYSSEWPNITEKRDAPADADEMSKVKDKLSKFFSPNPGKGD
jgi:ferredoxin